MRLITALSIFIAGSLFLIPGSRVHAAATNLAFTESCSNGKSNVTLSWTGTSSDGLQIWIDLTLFDNGWQAGTFIGAGPLAGSATSYVWNGLDANKTHYIRVNQQLVDGRWDTSQTYRFATRCGSGQSSPDIPAQGSSRTLGFSLLGPSGNNPPPNLTSDGGTLKTCNPSVLHAYVILNLATPKNVSMVWYMNGAPISAPRDLATIPAGPQLEHLSLTDFGSITARPGDSTVYSFKLSSGGTNVEAEGSVTISCS